MPAPIAPIAPSAEQALAAALAELVDADVRWRPVVLSAARGDSEAVVELAKAVRRVRSQEGVRRYHAPIGTPITPGMQRAARRDDAKGDGPRSRSSGAGASTGGRRGGSSDTGSAPRAGGDIRSTGPAAPAGKADLSTPRGAMAAIKAAPKVKADPADRDTQIARAAQLAASTRHPQVIFRQDDGSVRIGIASRSTGHEGRRKVLVQPNGAMFNVDEDGNREQIPHTAVAAVLAKYVPGADPGDHPDRERDRGTPDGPGGGAGAPGDGGGTGPTGGGGEGGRDRGRQGGDRDGDAGGGLTGPGGGGDRQGGDQGGDRDGGTGGGDRRTGGEPGGGERDRGRTGGGGSGGSGGGATGGRTAGGQVDIATPKGLMTAVKATGKVPRSQQLVRGRDEGLAGLRALQLSQSTRWQHKVWYDGDRIKVTKGPNTPPDGTAHTLVQANGRMFDVAPDGTKTEIPHGDVIARVGPHLGHRERSPMGGGERDGGGAGGGRVGPSDEQLGAMNDEELRDEVSHATRMLTQLLGEVPRDRHESDERVVEAGNRVQRAVDLIEARRRERAGDGTPTPPEPPSEQQLRAMSDDELRAEVTRARASHEDARRQGTLAAEAPARIYRELVERVDDERTEQRLGRPDTGATDEQLRAMTPEELQEEAARIGRMQARLPSGRDTAERHTTLSRRNLRVAMEQLRREQDQDGDGDGDGAGGGATGGTEAFDRERDRLMALDFDGVHRERQASRDEWMRARRAGDEAAQADAYQRWKRINTEARLRYRRIDPARRSEPKGMTRDDLAAERDDNAAAMRKMEPGPALDALAERNQTLEAEDARKAAAKPKVTAKMHELLAAAAHHPDRRVLVANDRQGTSLFLQGLARRDPDGIIRLTDAGRDVADGPAPKPRTPRGRPDAPGGPGGEGPARPAGPTVGGTTADAPGPDPGPGVYGEWGAYERYHDLADRAAQAEQVTNLTSLEKGLARALQDFGIARAARSRGKRPSGSATKWPGEPRYVIKTGRRYEVVTERPSRGQEFLQVSELGSVAQFSPSRSMGRPLNMDKLESKVAPHLSNTVEMPEPAARLHNPGGTHVGDAIDTTGMTGPSRVWTHRSMDAIARVHDDGGLRRATTRLDSPSQSRQAYYQPMFDGTGGTVGLNPDNKGLGPVISVTHEIGHMIDWTALGDKAAGYHTEDARRNGDAQHQAMLDFLKAAGDSKTIRDAKATKATKYRSYYLEPKEMWARAYAQFIANRADDVVMTRELRATQAKDRRQPIKMQWPDDDFGDIDRAVEGVLRAKGWME